MSNRTVKSGPKNGQLDLPLVSREPIIRKPQGEPIAVRIPEAIRLIGIGRSKLYELIASGDVEVVKIGRCTLIPTASLHNLIERAKSCPT
jgi:excisionase family DNA binding protein